MRDPVGTKSEADSSSITSEQFFDAMRSLHPQLPERLKAFLGRLAPAGVYPAFQRALNIKIDPPSGKPVNLGTIYRDGQVWTDAVNWRIPLDLAHRYNETLASAVGADLDKETLQGNWHIRQDGKAPRIVNLMDRLDAWAGVIEGFVTELRQRSAEDGEG